jgi:hypothetical protein
MNENDTLEKDQISGFAWQILASSPDLTVRLRLLRDVLKLDKGDPELITLNSGLAEHRWVLELTHAQHSDGSWGRFHSQNSSIKTKIPTTEAAIRRALALGLDKEFPILTRAISYIQDILDGKAQWSDRQERSEGWQIAVEAVSAGTLAQVDPSHPALTRVRKYWMEIAQRSFVDGIYDQQSEIRAHKETSGLKMVYLGSRYVLTLLGSKCDLIPPTLDRQIVDWIWNNENGIGYLGANMRHPDQFHINHWLDSMEILSQFRCWQSQAGRAMKWLWEQRGDEGLWDFGQRTSRTVYFPLSSTWRKPGNRRMDHSTRVLALLWKFVE